MNLRRSENLLLIYELHTAEGAPLALASLASLTVDIRQSKTVCATLGVVEVAPGASSGSEMMDVPVTAGLLIQIDIDESTQAGIGAPLTVVLAIDDGVAGGTTPGDDGNGATLPANAITENDEAVEQDGELLVEE